MNKAVILTARKERDSQVPYPLLPFAGDTCLMDRTLAILRENGIKQIGIVSGFCHEQFEKYEADDVTLIYNKEYECTASMGSLAVAKDFID